MARPLKQTVDYFPHDSHASDSKTLFILESKFGNDGYAFWFKLLELLSSSDGHVYDVRNPVAWEFLLAKTRIDNDRADKMMSLLVDLEAIDKELWSQRMIWVQNLVDRITDAYRNRLTDLPQRPSLNGKKPEPLEIDDVINEVSDVSNTQTKGKETKGNKKKDKIIYGQFSNVLLTTDEAEALIKKFGIAGMDTKVQNLSGYIASKGITRYKSHYATILNWARRDSDTEVPEIVVAPAPQNESIVKSLDAINEIFRKDLINERDAKFLGGFQLESNVGSSRNLYRVLQCLKGRAAVNASTKQAWTEELTKLGVEV